MAIRHADGLAALARSLAAEADLSGVLSGVVKAAITQIEGWAGAKEHGRFSAVFLDDSDLHPRVRQRIELTRELVEPRAAATFTVPTRGESRTERLFSLVLLACFAGFALLLAAVGHYGVVSYAVARRSRENGIRMALGAPKLDVLRTALAQQLRWLAAGLAAGSRAAGARLPDWRQATQWWEQALDLLAILPPQALHRRIDHLKTGTGDAIWTNNDRTTSPSGGK